MTTSLSLKQRRIDDSRKHNGNRTGTLTALLVCGISPFIFTGCNSTKPSSSGNLAELASPVPVEAYSINTQSLEGLVDAAMQHHPSITAAKAKVVRMEAMIPQAKALPDPMAKFTGGRMAETAAGRVDAMAGVEQRVPFPGKRKAAARIAASEVEAARAELENTQLVIAAQLRMTYWDYYLSSKSIAVLQESKTVLEELRESVDIRVRAGKASQQDLLRVSNSIAEIEKRLITARQKRTSTKARLNAMLHRPGDAPLPEPRWSESVAKLPEATPQSHPELKKAEARVSAFEARMKKAQLERMPDFVFGMQYSAVSDSGLAMSANGRDQYSATVGVTIPLWQKKLNAAAREAEAGIAESNAQLAALRDDLSYRVTDARTRVDAAQRIVTLFDKSILPEAEQALKLSLDEYSADTADFLDVIDAWRQSLNYQLQQEENLAALGKAAAAYRLAVGK